MRVCSRLAHEVAKVTELCLFQFFVDAFSLQFAGLCCHVKLMSGFLSLEVREQMLCSGLCKSAATNIVYLFTPFLGSDVNGEIRFIVHRVNIHIQFAMQCPTWK